LQELQQRAADELVTVIDVRTDDEFSSGHLPNAINIPLAELSKRLADLPKSKEIVAYCRGPWCVLAFEAVALLREQGFNARRLDGGFPEWRMAGLPVEEFGQAAG
jgi:ArsR family transcriptional regulator